MAGVIRIEPRVTILALYEARPDITLAEIKAALRQTGTRAGIGALWRLFLTGMGSRAKKPGRQSRLSGRLE